MGRVMSNTKSRISSVTSRTSFLVSDEVLGGLPSKQYAQGSRVDQLH
jgi:hypothetical protein